MFGRIGRGGHGTIMGFACDNCDTIVTAAADCEGCDRQLCLDCWALHAPCHSGPYAVNASPETSARRGVRCPVTDAPLISVTAVLTPQHDIDAWCQTTRSQRNGPCWPECDTAEDRLRGWLTASGRVKLPDPDGNH